LKRFSESIDRDENFSIYDQRDKEDILTAIIEELGYKTTVKKVLSNRESLPEKYIWDEYMFRLNRYNAIDIDMIQPMFFEILHNPAVLQYLQSQYHYYFVDEFQDTDKTQMDILRKLDPENLFVVGDDYQSIYRFRGACVENILEFPNIYPGSETIILNRNYRSTKNIVNAANNVISNNVSQIKKDLVTEREGSSVEIAELPDVDSEFDWIAKNISETGAENKDYAILCRTNRYALAACDYLKSRLIPAKVLTNKDSIFDMPDIKKIISFIEVAVNPLDEKKILDTVQFPYKTISDTGLKKIVLKSKTLSRSLYEIIGEFYTSKITKFIESAKKLSTMKEFFMLAVETLELESFYEKRDLTGRIGDIHKAFLTFEIWERVQHSLSEPTDFSAFIKWLKLKDIQENFVQEEMNVVKILTVHGAKGLEFPIVFVPGLYEGHFPISNNDDMEEERRLFYVAITRAKDKLFLSYPQGTTSIISPYSGKYTPVKPSKFIFETII
jgi:DNA helicase-2/ATP-dependent DNA helicase PcrA